MILARLILVPFYAVFLLVCLLALFVAATLGFVFTGDPYEVKANYPAMH